MLPSCFGDSIWSHSLRLSDGAVAPQSWRSHPYTRLMNGPQGDENFSVARVLFDIIDVEGYDSYGTPPPGGDQDVLTFGELWLKMAAGTITQHLKPLLILFVIYAPCGSRQTADTP